MSIGTTITAGSIYDENTVFPIICVNPIPAIYPNIPPNIPVRTISVSISK